MAIPPLDLDDRTFDQLATEGRALIARHFPAWTDYNPSDPGITLIELFAYLTEAAIYQINRVPERSRERFAALVGVARQPAEPIAQTLSRALAEIQQHYRAITEQDFETLAIEANPSAIARAKAVVTAPGDGSAAAPGSLPADQLITVVIVPVEAGAPIQALCDQVFAYLAPRRLITTGISVVPADRTPVNISVTVARDLASDAIALGNSIRQEMTKFLDDRGGGFDGTGWPFGRAIYRSDLYRLIEGLDGVDHVADLLLAGDQSIGEIPLVSPLSLVGRLTLSVAVV
jgi:Baseplate J-like protein